jgi:hypothetical protein
MAVCGDNVQDMSQAYVNCNNIITAVCGPRVYYMNATYRDCSNLKTAICGPNVRYMRTTFGGCPNISGNAYFYSPNLYDVLYCFRGRNVSNMLNIYAPANSQTMTKLLNAQSPSMVGANCSWTNDSTNNRYYNTQYNIYIYPVANVEEARIANGD